MSTDVTFVGIGSTEIDGPFEPMRVPCVVTEIYVGMSILKDTLEDFEGPIMKDPTATEPGSRRFLVTNPQSFIEGLEKWQKLGEPDNHGYDGFNGSIDIVDTIREHPGLTWWFHINS